MNLVADYFRDLFRAALDGWNRFWFTPTDVATLALVRILAGAMILYTHLVWSLNLEGFFGPRGLVPVESARSFYGDSFRWAASYLWYVESPTLLWTVHIAGLIAIAMFTAGLFTRITSVLTFVVAVSYVNRVPGALFGLDQINVMLATYLMFAPCGGAYSLDRLIAARRAGGALPPAAPTTMTCVAVRLIQLHMCIIYFFSGLGKLQGETWWAGNALWGAVLNLEYQTVDLTWLLRWPILTAVLTQLTAYWELFFCVLVWPRLLRPICLGVAVVLHLSIGICMGLMTFGLVMPIAVTSFVPPEFVRRLLDGGAISDEQAEQGRGVGREVRRAS